MVVFGKSRRKNALAAALVALTASARDTDYEHAPLRTYASDNSIAVPQIRFEGNTSVFQEDQLLFISHHGGSVPKEEDGIAILQTDGEPVWVTTKFGHVHNFRVQHFRGKPHLSLWSGKYTNNVPRGLIHLLDETYETVDDISTDPLPDLHEFQIADGGQSALVAVQQDVQTHLGTTLGTWVRDGCFHEIDIDTGEKNFGWCAADHVSPDFSFVPKALSGFKSESSYDFFHLNSAYKDERGNYLVSGRSMHALYYIDPQGQIIWQLGGVENDFTGDDDWQFGWQHHASFVSSISTEEERCISIFDNGTNGFSLIATRWTSRGLMLCINEETRTVRKYAEYPAPDELHWQASSSQGSVQVLDDGNVLVGFGKEPFFVVYTNDGEPILTGAVGSHAESYRTFVSKWVGKPNTRPLFVVQSNAEGDAATVLVSWNGATEVATWQVLGGDDAEHLRLVSSARKRGFETSIALTESPAWLQLVAIDKSGQELGRSIASPVDMNMTSAAQDIDSTSERGPALVNQQPESGLRYFWNALLRWMGRP